LGYFDDARNLISHSKQKINDIEGEYEKSLSEKTVRTEFLIEIKNLMENLRSALDFAAHSLFEKYGLSSKGFFNIYFPYATITQDLHAFQKDKKIEKCIPGIAANHPDIVSKIESMQHWNPDFTWLPDFMKLNNENKHQRLTPQIRTEQQELRIISDNASIVLGQGAGISIETGASIEIGNGVIPSNQRFDLSDPPVILGDGRSEITTWISFQFETNNQPVLPFLNTVITGVERIINELSLL